ncbi:MAG: hypothetical protein QME96_17375, partial [Myxococcota bacterium]|nr:hypothetical protein [Myxococcota bacterium]
GEIVAGGADAGDLRDALAPPDTRAGVVAALIERDLPGAHVVAVDVSGIEPDSPTLHAGYVGSVRSFGRVAPEGLTVPIGVRLDLLRRFAAATNRTTDLDLAAAGFPLDIRREARIFPRGGWIWDRLPRGADDTGPFGSFSIDARIEDDGLVVSVAVSIPRTRIPAADYPAFRGFLERIDAAIAQTATAVRRMP